MLAAAHLVCVLSTEGNISPQPSSWELISSYILLFLPMPQSFSQHSTVATQREDYEFKCREKNSSSRNHWTFWKRKMLFFMQMFLAMKSEGKEKQNIHHAEAKLFQNRTFFIGCQEVLAAVYRGFVMYWESLHGVQAQHWAISVSNTGCLIATSWGGHGTAARWPKRKKRNNKIHNTGNESLSLISKYDLR